MPILLDDFYGITGRQTGEMNSFELRLNADHAIFEGHFPGNPVVPGVCMTQIVKECLEQVLDKKTMLVIADNIKFTAVLNPREHTAVTLQFNVREKENGLLQVDARLLRDQVNFFSFKGKFRVK